MYQLTSFQLTSFQLTGGEGDPVHISLRRRQQALFEWRRSRRSKRVSCRSWRSQASHRTRSHDPEVWARLLIDLIGPSSKWPQRIRLAWFAGDQPGKHSQWLITYMITIANDYSTANANAATSLTQLCGTACIELTADNMAMLIHGKAHT